jgi:hypothetical protein
MDECKADEALSICEGAHESSCAFGDSKPFPA